jgi:predicted DNA-binding transcriptional regulator YafY
MRYWALQYGPNVEITAPENLKEQIKNDIKQMAIKYKAV